MGWFSRRKKQAPPAVEANAGANAPEARLAQLEADIGGRVPAAVQSRVARVATTIRATLPRLTELGIGSSQAYAVVQTATSYLPEALNGYMRLPREFADKRAVSNGKTSLMVLCDQLDLLANKMDEVFDAVCRSDADALIAHGRFLAEKFGHGSLEPTPLAQGTPGSVAGQRLQGPS